MNRVFSPSVLLLVLVLTLPRVGAAAPSLLGPEAAPSRSARLLSTSSEASPEDLPVVGMQDVKDTGQVLTEVVLGAVGGAVGLAAGYAVGLGVFYTLCGPSDIEACFTTGVVTTLLGGALGVSGGVTLGGALVGRQGHWLTGGLPGALVGGAAGVGLGLAITEQGDSRFTMLLVAPPLMLLGALIGHEISHAALLEEQRLQPVVSVTPRGATFGLAGRF
ncbi:hypothetical protein [Archangium primigenium]|uniref:hypothetical protein n=1 Tax=[Archangium] primigenium TaxID=2792470 RepID=UPI00195EFA46|nr:hypothetical protein [Archangium primigenium]MBM7113005.1 hypothetical protein [Archangium primigenium]